MTLIEAVLINQAPSNQFECFLDGRNVSIQDNTANANAPKSSNPDNRSFSDIRTQPAEVTL